MILLPFQFLPWLFAATLRTPSTITVLRATKTAANLPHECDIAIVGSGFAGLAAALEASRICPKAKIVVVEKMPVPGGNSVMNAGQIAAVNTAPQVLAGITDSVELMMDDMVKAGIDLNHPNLLQKMIAESNDVVKWTQEELGVEYRDRVTQLGGHSVPRTLSTLHASGNDFIRPMLALLKEKRPNVQLLMNTGMVGLVMGSNEPEHDEHPRVQGILVVHKPSVGSHHTSAGKDTNNTPHWTLTCRQGVVLASGGFSADVAFRQIQNPSYDSHVDSTNQPGATAEVLKEALKAGAMSVQLSHIQLGPWTSPDEHGFGKAPFFCLGAGFPYGILVDPTTSKRFVNELGNRYERSMAILKTVGHPVICITDREGAQHSLTLPLEDLEPTVKPFATVEDLCQHYGLDPVVLAETLSEYNAGVRLGKDAFGKALRDDLIPIEHPPYYAVRLWPKVHHCMGGLHINEHAQVIHIDGYPIPGLYAAGEVVGGVHGGDRLGSCATLDCMAFGRIAGRNVVAQQLQGEPSPRAEKFENSTPPPDIPAMDQKSTAAVG